MKTGYVKPLNFAERKALFDEFEEALAKRYLEVPKSPQIIRMAEELKRKQD